MEERTEGHAMDEDVRRGRLSVDLEFELMRE